MSYDVSTDDAARDRLVNELKSTTLATLVIDGKVYIGFRSNRDEIERQLAG